jgi:hypothetical protein
MLANNNLAPGSAPRFVCDQYGNLGAVLSVTDVHSTIAKDFIAPEKARISLGRNRRKLRNSSAKESRRGCSGLLAGDCNGDCKINFRDVACIGQNWLADTSEEL